MDFETDKGFVAEELGVAEDVEEVSSDEEMPQDEEAMAEESDAQMPEAVVDKPPKGYVPQKDLDGLRSSYDRQVAEAKARAQSLETQLAAIRAERDEMDKRMLAVETRDMDEDQAAVVRERYEVAKLKREAQDERRQVEAEKAVIAAQRAEVVKDEYATHFAQKYGVAKQVLLDVETRDPHEMELVAKTYSLARRGAVLQQRKAAGTDNIGSGQPTSTAPGNMAEANRRYAAGLITFEQYSAVRKKAGYGD